MENLNPKSNPITTITGGLFIVVSLLMYSLPMFMTVHKDFTDKWYIPLIPVGIGVLLLFSPDSIVRGADKTIDKFTDKKE